MGSGKAGGKVESPVGSEIPGLIEDLGTLVAMLGLQAIAGLLNIFFMRFS